MSSDMESTKFASIKASLSKQIEFRYFSWDENVATQINNFDNLKYPIEDLLSINIKVKTYASVLTEDYVNDGKPLKEDDFEIKKSIEDLKKDLMKLKLVMVNLEN